MHVVDDLTFVYFSLAYSCINVILTLNIALLQNMPSYLIKPPQKIY